MKQLPPPKQDTSFVLFSPLQLDLKSSAWLQQLHMRVHRCGLGEQTHTKPQNIVGLPPRLSVLKVAELVVLCTHCINTAQRMMRNSPAWSHFSLLRWKTRCVIRVSTSLCWMLCYCVVIVRKTSRRVLIWGHRIGEKKKFPSMLLSLLLFFNFFKVLQDKRKLFLCSRAAGVCALRYQKETNYDNYFFFSKQCW